MAMRSITSLEIWNSHEAAVRGDDREARMRRLLELPIRFVPHPSFDDPDMHAEILGPGPFPAAETSAAPDAAAAGFRFAHVLECEPLLTREQEGHLFRKMNFLKHQAVSLLARADPDGVETADLERIEELHREAVAINNKILRANVRLVGAFVKRWLRPGQDFFEMLSDGHFTLIHATQRFDFSMGVKFSTYASWALVNNFSRAKPRERFRKERFVTGQSAVLESASDHRLDIKFSEARDERIRKTVTTLLRRLNDRERSVIASRYGLDGSEEKTLRELGEELGITKERVRQIEARAREKLSKIAQVARVDPDFG